MTSIIYQNLLLIGNNLIVLHRTNLR